MSYVVTLGKLYIEIDAEIPTSYDTSGDVFHTPIANSKRYYEPIMLGLRDFNITIYVKGENLIQYQENLRDILEVLQSGVPQSFVHPFQGQTVVAVDRKSIKVSESFENYLLSTIEVTLLEITPPKSYKAPKIKIRLDRIHDQLQEEFSERLQVELLPMVKTKLLSLQAKLKLLIAPLLANLAKVTAVMQTQSKILGIVSSATSAVSGAVFGVIATFGGLVGGVSILKYPNSVISQIRGQVSSTLGKVFSSSPKSPFLNENTPALILGIVTSSADISQKSEQVSVLGFPNVGEVDEDNTAVESLAELVASMTSRLAQDALLVENNASQFQDLATVEAMDRMQYLTEYTFALSLLSYSDYLKNYTPKSFDTFTESIKVCKRGLLSLRRFSRISDNTIATVSEFVDISVATYLEDFKQADLSFSELKVSTYNKPLRSVVYQNTGDLDSILSIYEWNVRNSNSKALNKWLDIGETPDSLTII